MVQLIDNLLELATLDSLPPSAGSTEVSVSALLESALAPWHKRAVKQYLSLSIEVEPALSQVVVKADRERIDRVLQHFLDNAFKFSQQGQITLRARRTDRDQHRLGLRIEVQDQGIGISAERQTRIFEPFEQADSSSTRAYGGAGVGLAICKWIVDAMDGQIGVESSPGQGSLFWIELVLDTSEATDV